MDWEVALRTWAVGILLILAWIMAGLLLAGFGYGITAVFTYFNQDMLGSILWLLLYIALLPFLFGYLAKIIVDWLE